MAHLAITRVLTVSALASVYLLCSPTGSRSCRAHGAPATAKLRTGHEARRMAVNIAKVPPL
jgi:hypothetical protein